MSIDDPLTRGRKTPNTPAVPVMASDTTGAMPSSKPSAQGCSTGSQGGSGKGLGSQSDAALSTGLDPKLKSAFIEAKQKWEAANPGLKVYAFSGVSARPANPNSVHPQGKAMDVAIYGTDGKIFNNLYNGDTPAFRAYESFASAMGDAYGNNGKLRWGGNFGGNWYHDSMHFDISGVNPSRGNVFEGRKNPMIANNSDPSKGIIYDGPKDAASANAGSASKAKGLGSQNDSALTSQGNTANAVCGSPSSSGCQPISAGVAAVASSVMNGNAMSIPSSLTNPISAIQSAVGGLLQGGLQNAIGNAAGMLSNGALGMFAGGIQSLTQTALSNVLTQITTPIMTQLQGVGGGILSSLTGVIPSSVSSTVSGGLSGLLTSNIQNTANSILKGGTPQLGGFASIFSTASSASSGGSNLQQALQSSTSQVFGKATDGVLKSSSIPGYNTSSITSSMTLTGEDEGTEIYDGIVDQQWIPAASRTQSFVRPLPEVLDNAISADKINGFGSLFKDYNSMVTQGFGNLTDHLLALGADLVNLGSLGDMNDLLNIGTPKQVARQIIEHGMGVKTGLIQKMFEFNLPVTEVQNEESDPLILNILGMIDDPDVIDDIKDVFGIADTVALKSLADLIDPNIVLPQSKDYNYFKNIRDIGPTLMLCCKSMGDIKTFGDLGRLMINMETAETFTALLNEYHVIRFNEAVQLQQNLPPQSMFSEDGPVIADFIGTAAGYIHSNTLPRMQELHTSIFNDAALAKFRTLMQLLTDVLSGVYISGSNIIIPTTAGYTFGTYTTLNAASLAVKTAIETEMTSLKANLPTSNPTLWAKIAEYESLHVASSEFLAHEKKMRIAYGVDIGEPTVTENFRGDGTTKIFPLNIKAAGNITVYVDGKLIIENRKWTYNSTTNAVTILTAPASGIEVNITYDTGRLKPQSSTTDVWQFASSIESHALATGYGGPAEFLNRIATNDMEGQRLKAIMIQARNKARLDNVGIGCPGFNRVLNDDDTKDFNFVEKTGIWSSDVNRASEIYLQRNQDVSSSRDYVLNRLSENADRIHDDMTRLAENVTRQLVFVQGDSVIVSDKLVTIYQNSSDDKIFKADRPDMELSYSLSYPVSGYLLGKYDEIMTSIIRAEGFSDTTFNTDLSESTKVYLAKMSVDMDFLTSVIQRTIMVTVAKSLGISEDELRELFGVFSVSKSILANVVKGV